MSIGTSARPPTPTTPPVRPDEKVAIRVRLEDHRKARQDQIEAHTFAHADSSDLDPAARMRALAVARLTLLGNR